MVSIVNPPAPKPCEVAAALKRSFVWGITHQGFDYWEQVFNNLLYVDKGRKDKIQSQINELKQQIIKLEGELK